MKLYHGSTLVVNKPTIFDTQRLLDFGNGFYTTTNKKQAEDWALIKQKRVNINAHGIVSVYELNYNVKKKEASNIKIFKSASEEWLDFIVSNRKGFNKHSYNIVQGPVANDTLYSTLLLYENNILTKKETIVRLKTHKLFDQISFHNIEILKNLHFIESYTLKERK